MLHITTPTTLDKANFHSNSSKTFLPISQYLTLTTTMGNCIVLQKKLVRVMKTDGKILEYKSPIKVHQVLSEYSHHAVSDKLPVVKHMHPSDEMLGGHLYYLLPLPVQPVTPIKNKKKKTVRFSDDVIEFEAKQEQGPVRIKLVISKQELHEMLAKEGVSVEDMIYKMQKENKLQDVDGYGDGGVACSR